MSSYYQSYIRDPEQGYKEYSLHPNTSPITHHGPKYSSFNYVYTNYPSQEGYTFPGGYGYYYVFGIDGNKTLVRHDKISKPTSLLGTMCCPCFTVEDPWSPESKIRYRNCLLSLTTFFSLIQIVLFIVCVAVGGFVSVYENRTLGPSMSTLLLFGAKDAYLIKYKYQLWRLITPIFLSSGVIHLVLNLFAQLRLGMYFEKEWRWWKYLIVYFACGVGSTLMSCILQPERVSVASTGAILGTMAAYFAQLTILWQTFDRFQRNLQLAQLIAFFVLLLFLSLSSYVDISSHLGGIVTGFLLGWAMWDQEVRTHGWIVPTVLLLIYFTGGFVLFFMYVNVTPPVIL